jgi:hypothetical protein
MKMNKELREILKPWGQACYTGYVDPANVISAILKLFNEEMLRLIDNNRESLARLINKHIFNADMTENSPVRNLHIYALVDDLRAELRKKVEVDNG